MREVDPVTGVQPSDVCGVVIEQPSESAPQRVSHRRPGAVERLAALDRRVRLLRSIGLRRVTVTPARAIDPGHSLSALVHEAERGVVRPIDGIVAAMRFSPERHLLAMRVGADLDRSVLLTLLRRCGPTSGAALRTRARSWEPLCAVYPPNALSIAESESREGGTPASLVTLLRSVGRVSTLDLGSARETPRRTRGPNRGRTGSDGTFPAPER